MKKEMGRDGSGRNVLEDRSDGSRLQQVVVMSTGGGVVVPSWEWIEEQFQSTMTPAVSD